MKKIKLFGVLLGATACLFISQTLVQANEDMNYVLNSEFNNSPVMEQPLFSNLKSFNLPEIFDPRDGLDSPVSDQKNSNLCWAYTGLEPIESAVLRKEGQISNFSPIYASYVLSNKPYESGALNPRGYNRPATSGGQISWVMMGMMNWELPVKQENFFIDNPDNLPLVQEGQLDENPSVHVQGISHFPRLKNDYSKEERIERQKILKASILEHSSLAYSLRGDVLYGTPENGFDLLYNEKNSAMYVPKGRFANNISNHTVTVVGWNDNYSKKNFATEPEENGAFIVKNSWGTDFGDEGYFYVSYEDYFITRSLMYGITQTESTDNYDNQYRNAQFYDRASIGGYVTIEADSYALANVFEIDNPNETLQAVSIYTDQYNTPYEVYILPNAEDFNKPLVPENMIKVASGEKLIPGFETLSLEEEIEITNSEKFAVVVKLFKPENVDNFYISTDDYNYSRKEEGKTYIASMNGTQKEMNFIANDTRDNKNAYKGHAYINAYTNNSTKNSTVKYTFKDSNNIDFTTMIVDSINGELTVDTPSNDSPDAKVPGIYTAIQLHDKVGTNKYEQVYLGTKRFQSIQKTCPISLGDYITVYQKDYINKLEILNLDINEPLEKKEKVSYQVTENGLQIVDINSIPSYKDPMNPNLGGIMRP